MVSSGGTKRIAILAATSTALRIERDKICLTILAAPAPMMSTAFFPRGIVNIRLMGNITKQNLECQGEMG
jgi:hypothetical protein